ncbi:hypothetical protein T08_8213 [Trichinella sp. T8]|nr:hypothetical protein T08_8213 [Trichinella sp. T8]
MSSGKSNGFLGQIVYQHVDWEIIDLRYSHTLVAAGVGLARQAALASNYTTDGLASSSNKKHQMDGRLTGPSCVNRRAPTSKRNTAQLTESKQRIMRELVDGGEPGLKPQIGQVEFDSRLGHFASDVSFIGQQACLQDGQAGRPRLTKQGPAFSSWLRFCSAPLLAPLNSALPKPGPRALNNTFLSFLREKGEGPERRSAFCRRVQLPIFDVTVILILHGFWAKQTIKEKRAS